MEHLQYFKVDQYFALMIINAENTSSHKFRLSNVRSMFRAISEVVEIPSQSQAQVHLMIFFYNEIQVSDSSSSFKI